MTTLRLVGGLPLIVGGELAVAAPCCCGGTCCACWLNSGSACRLTDESLQLLSDTLASFGNRNVTVSNQTGDAVAWSYQCCEVAEAGCVTITVDCVEEGSETLTFCPCTSVSAGCADGVKEEECAYEWTPGVNCETGPCPPCDGPCSQANPCPSGCRCLDGHCVGKCQGGCDAYTPCAYGCHCVSGQCQPCPCNSSTDCTSGDYICAEYQYSGDDCIVATGVSFYAASGGVVYKPCGSQSPVGFNSVELCAGGASDQYTISGVWSCGRVVYAPDCDCTAYDCDWVNVVAEWRGLPNTTQCDCTMNLISYTIKSSSASCP